MSKALQAGPPDRGRISYSRSVFAVGGEPPDTDDSVREIVGFYKEHKDQS